jgi:hypothetical protein
VHRPGVPARRDPGCRPGRPGARTRPGDLVGPARSPRSGRSCGPSVRPTRYARSPPGPGTDGLGRPACAFPQSSAGAAAVRRPMSPQLSGLAGPRADYRGQDRTDSNGGRTRPGHWPLRDSRFSEPAQADPPDTRGGSATSAGESLRADGPAGRSAEGTPPRAPGPSTADRPRAAARGRRRHHRMVRVGGRAITPLARPQSGTQRRPRPCAVRASWSEARTRGLSRLTPSRPSMRCSR